MNNNFDIIQELLRKKADFQARLALLPYEDILTKCPFTIQEAGCNSHLIVDFSASQIVRNKFPLVSYTVCGIFLTASKTALKGK